MISSTQTTTALLDGLRDEADADAWSRFDARYRPIIDGFVRRMGLTADDAADVAQETLARFVQEYRTGAYVRERGRLRSWLIGIARHRALDALRARARRREWRGESGIDEVPDENHLSAIWDEECRRSIMRVALEQLPGETQLAQSTVRAFEMLAIGGHDPKGVAEVLGMSVNEVYVAKHRVLRKLRSIIDSTSRSYELSPPG